MNRAQRRQLRAYLHFRYRRMSVLALIRFNWNVFLLMALAGAISVSVMLYQGDVFWAWVLGVAYGAIMLRDLGQCLRWSRTWPMTSELMDWAKVERLAAEKGIAAGDSFGRPTSASGR